MRWVTVFTSLTWCLSFIFTIYAVYNFSIAVFAGRKLKARPHVAPKTRFAVLIAARNEELVIGSLIQSLLAQDYPRELYDIYVIPNNCTDDTAGAARRAGAKLIDCTVPVKCKGDVLSFTMDLLMKEDRYDAFCVFDADNLVDPGYLAAMNDAYQSGARVAQSYRDSKNPYDSAMSGCYSIYFWMVDRFYNKAREVVGLSALISGCGFMAAVSLIKEMGGFHTFTMTEDSEFTAQCVLRGERVHYVPEARFYDEQPLTFIDSWKQRKRWASGPLQGMKYYFPKLLRRAFTKRDFAALDMCIFLLAMIMQILCAVSFLLSWTLNALYIHFELFPNSTIYYNLFQPFGCSFFVSAALAVLTLLLEKKFSVRMFKAIAYYGIFVITWIPITIRVLFNKNIKWDEIRHTRAVQLNELK